MRLSFRADVDYLRALAVVSVIGFHYDVPGFSGGFVGVDIFFVISGFLISRLIWTDLEGERFSFARFYERRARRLLPALYVVILITGVGAWFLAPPNDYRLFFESAVSALLFTSNIHFWSQAGYFDLPAISKVLIHTWSLSVEEQFYFIFPLATWVWSRWFRDPSCATSLSLIISGAIGLCVWDELLIKHHAQSAFYFSPLRAWEFQIGSVAYFVQRWSPSRLVLRSAFVMAGLASMLLPVCLYGSDTRFPGLHALIPCLGAALFIIAFNRDGDGPWLPAKPVGLFLGRISYSLYLWHWPVFVLGTAALPLAWASAPVTKAAFVVGSLVLAQLTFLAIEAPARARKQWNGIRITGMIAGSSALLLAIAAIGIVENGYPGRYPASQQRMLRYNGSVMAAAYRQQSCLLLPHEAFSSYREAECLAFAAGRKNVLLFGDSAAAHYYQALRGYLIDSRYNLLQLTSASCSPFVDLQHPASNNCDQVNAKLREILHSGRLSAVIIAGNWRAYRDNHLGPPDTSEKSGAFATAFDAHLGATLSAAERSNIPTLLFGPSVEFPIPLASSLVSRALTNFPPEKSFVAVPASFATDENMRRLARAYRNVSFASVLNAACPDELCPLTVDAETPIVWDTLHLTPEGARYVVDRLRPALDGFFAGSPDASEETP